MTIKILPARLANQIAAGEVVERPASVVKELLENSIDAGATKIDVEIIKGGHKRVLIRDNGKGVAKEELELALSRHATSKIQSLDDLENVMSLGFRGEALASISSVSRLRFISKPSEQSEAWQAQCEGREMAVALSPVAHPNGTCVDVQDLFFNTPARRKFLRTEKTEFSHIDELFKRAALSHFNIQFSLRHNDKVVRQFPAALSDVAKFNRIAQICGNKFKQSAIAFSSAYEDIEFNGWVGGSGSERAQNDQQYVYINGRMMRDKLVAHAVRQAYEGLIPANSYPAYAVYLTMPAAMLDVNVHPTKQEVRFHQARLVHDFIYRTINDALQQYFMPTTEQVATGNMDIVSEEITYANSTNSESRPYSEVQERRFVEAQNSAALESESQNSVPFGNKLGSAVDSESTCYSGANKDSSVATHRYTSLASDSSHQYIKPLEFQQNQHSHNQSQLSNNARYSHNVAPDQPSKQAIANYNRLMQPARDSAHDETSNLPDVTRGDEFQSRNGSRYSIEQSSESSFTVGLNEENNAQSDIFGQCVTLANGCILGRLNGALYLIDGQSVTAAMLAEQWHNNQPVAQPLLLPVAVSSKDIHISHDKQTSMEVSQSDELIAALSCVSIDVMYTGKKWVLKQVPAGFRQYNWTELLPNILTSPDILDNTPNVVASLLIASQFESQKDCFEYPIDKIWQWLVQCIHTKRDISQLIKEIDEDMLIKNMA